MSKIIFRIEVMTVQRMNEIECDEPEGWAAMTNAEKDAWCLDGLDDVLSNYVGTSFEYEGQDQ